MEFWGRKPHHQTKLTKGRFKPPRGTTVIPGVDNTRRYIQTYISFHAELDSTKFASISPLWQTKCLQVARYCSAVHCNFFDRRSFLISLIYWCFLYILFHRCFLGENTGPATWPDSNRYMECLIEKLCSVFPGHVREQGKTVQRWTLISHAYRNIRHKVLSNASLTRHTQLQLIEINQQTLIQWYVFKFLFNSLKTFMWMLWEVNDCWQSTFIWLHVLIHILL